MIRKATGGFLLKCDKCGAWLPVNGPVHERDAVREARKSGWNITKGSHLCDECNEKRIRK